MQNMPVVIQLIGVLYVTTGQSSQFICPPGPVYLFPNSSDCTKFIYCSNGKPYSMNCPSGLHFNPKLLVCDYPSNAGCILEDTPPETTSQQTSLTTITVNTTTITGRPSTTESQPTTTTPITTVSSPTTVASTSQQNPSAPVVCENEGDFIRDPVNCSCYYQCAKYNSPAFFCCPANLLFNPILNVCDWPENVVCNDTEEAPPEVSTTESPTSYQTTSTTTIITTTTSTITTEPTTTTISTTTEPTATTTTTTSTPSITTSTPTTTSVASTAATTSMSTYQPTTASPTTTQSTKTTPNTTVFLPATVSSNTPSNWSK